MTDPQKKEELLTQREQFAERFLEYPLIYFVVRSWLLSWRARFAMILGLALLITIILGMPAIWRTTPKGFTPEIKISLLDEVKARALERNAKKYLAQGRTDYGIMAYRAAITHNEGNLDRQRTYLKLATKRQIEKGAVEMDTINDFGLHVASWVNRVSKDPEDLALVVEFFNALEFDDDVIGLLEPNIKHHPVALKKMYARALLRQGFTDNFEVIWQRESPKGEWESDPEMKLYRAAATAAFGPADKAIEAKEILKSSLLNGDQKIAANQLFEIVAFERHQPDEYLPCLKRLADWHVDRLLDHTHAWQLLAALDRKDEALRLADQFNRAPRTAIETSQLAAAYIDLGMDKDAIKLLDQFIERFGFMERLWVQESTLLVHIGDWVALRNLIAKMRLDPAIANRMEGFSYYLEGRSELGEKRTASARELFERIPQFGIPNMDVAFTVIDQMHQLGHLDIAAKLVEQVEERAHDYPRYWIFVAQLASELKSEDLLLKSTEQYLRLLPEDAAAKNNFAAALLAARQRSGEAVKVTFDVLSSAPNVPGFQINHAAALALNARYKDAEETLMNVDLLRLGELERSMYYFILTESLFGQQKYSQARAAASKIQDRFLYPRQTEVLSKWRVKMDAELKPSSEASK